MPDIWSEALHELEPRLDKQTFDMWLRPIRLSGVEGDLLELHAPNRFLKEWFETHYLDLALDELEARHERRFAVKIEVVEDLELPARDADERANGRAAAAQVEPTPAPRREYAPAPAPALRRQPQPPVGLHPRYRFGTFIKGACNELAASAAMAAADEPGTRFNPLFIYGGVGLGKTHLLHGVGHELHRKDPSMRIVLLSAEQFMNEFVTAVRNNEFDEFRTRYRRDCDCLLIDDVQFIAGRDRTMDEFFHVFNALYESGKQIVVTADRVPADMAGMEERLTSRLNWGLVADVQAPDLETRIAIVQAKAERDGIPLRSDVALAIAELVPSNVRELEGALLRITAFAELRGAAIDAEFVRAVLGKGVAGERSPLTIDTIQKAVAGFYSVRISDLKGKRRHRGISRPRMIAMYLCRQLTKASFPEIGMRFGGKDHSTVINACKRIEALQADDDDLRSAVESLRDQLNAA
ncbi:chromosomal replication initiator protein DnaA [Pseudenhygromyxa sp. WMMC2535]|uniref:chromosomal replication initiator protein DnaA n=1 Tax=Pseudenhygromyxa sp. WMMC2535 TaxID=2712867 RepID=UPI0015550B3B|nr:chromosomal replication initiator protein DnaA [Pseudenhygromyxa sp. WMMC2535]NVB37882.1 chromosomal replication initiator protein DnaA [Pseudenhygromyxa sp. WMMC2535]